MAENERVDEGRDVAGEDRDDDDDGKAEDVVLNMENGEEEKRVSCDGKVVPAVVVVRSREDWRKVVVVDCGLVL